MEGHVVSFILEKRYGFIKGSDGNSYFAHQNEVANKSGLVTGQTVSFEPVPTPKGYKAKSINPGLPPTKIYADPDEFIITKKPEIKRAEILKKVGINFGAQTNGPQDARDMLKKMARQKGANAIVNYRMVVETGGGVWSNYQYTLHTAYGDPVVAKKAVFSNDKNEIMDSQRDVKKLDNIECDVNLFETTETPGWVNFLITAAGLVFFLIIAATFFS